MMGYKILRKILMMIILISLAINCERILASEEMNVPITFEKAFPDKNFRDYINEYIFTENLSETNVLDEIHQGELENYTGEIDLSNKKIVSMQGLHYFKELKGLNVSGNYLVELELSECTKLVRLDCSDNELEELNVSNNIKLQELYCQYNKIKLLDLSKTTELVVLNIYKNAILGFDMTSFESKNLTTLVNGKMITTLVPMSVGKKYGIVLPENAKAPINSSLPEGSKYLVGSRAILWEKITDIPSSFTYEYMVGGSTEPGSEDIIRVTVNLDKTTIVEYAVTVETPANFKVKGASYNSVELSWKKVGDITGYKIYRSNQKSSRFKLLKTIAVNGTTSYKDKKLICGKKYYYKILAYRDVEGVKYYSKESSVILCKPVPKATSIHLRKVNSNAVEVKWKKNSVASGYYIYRSRSKSRDYKLVETVTSKNRVTWKNYGLKEGKYYYKVRVYRKYLGKKVRSPYSKVKGKKI